MKVVEFCHPKQLFTSSSALTLEILIIFPLYTAGCN
jgi:hypothetical protein